MPRPSKIDRLPEEVKEQIGRLRRQGRTLDEILAKLCELLPPEEQPSWSGLQRHVQRIDVLADHIRVSDAIADRIVGVVGSGSEDKVMRANARLLGGAVFELLSSVENGEAVTLDPKDAKLLSETLRNISTAQKNHAEFAAKIREEQRRLVEEEIRKKLEDAGNSGVDAEALAEARRIMGFAV